MNPNYPDPRHYFNGFGNGFGPAGWPLEHALASAIGLLLWLALIGFIAWTVMRLTAQPESRPRVEEAHAPSAMELLRQRYVMGDIDALTFEEMTERLMASEAWERQSEVERLLKRRSPEGPTPTAQV